MLYDELSKGVLDAAKPNDRDKLEDLESRNLLYRRLLGHYYISHNPHYPQVLCTCSLCDSVRRILSLNNLKDHAKLWDSHSNPSTDEMADAILKEVEEYDQGKALHSFLMKHLTPSGRARYLSRIGTNIRTCFRSPRKENPCNPNPNPSNPDLSRQNPPSTSDPSA